MKDKKLLFSVGWHNSFRTYQYPMSVFNYLASRGFVPEETRIYICPDSSLASYDFRGRNYRFPNRKTLLESLEEVKIDLECATMIEEGKADILFRESSKKKRKKCQPKLNPSQSPRKSLNTENKQ
jgi:hypothetical protein